MQALIDILTTLSDKELAFLYTYNLDQYMLETQQKIKDYIFLTRNLSISEINTFIQTSNTEGRLGGCPRCHSTNWNIFDVYWEIPLSSSGYLLNKVHTLSDLERSKLTSYYPQKKKIECNICGYIIHDPNISLWGRLKNSWKKRFK